MKTKTKMYNNEKDQFASEVRKQLRIENKNNTRNNLKKESDRKTRDENMVADCVVHEI